MKNSDVNIQYAQHPAYAEAPTTLPIFLSHKEALGLNFVFILPYFLYYHMYVSNTVYYLISLVLSLYVNGIMPETCFYSVTSHL